MHLVFDICQGIGVAAAVGVRPFLPALVTGALAAGNVEIHFKHTEYSFLQSVPFLLAVAVCVVLGLLLAARLGAQPGPACGDIVLAVISLALGALFFAGSLARGHYAAWPGLIGGVVCAAVGIAATQPLLPARPSAAGRRGGRRAAAAGGGRRRGRGRPVGPRAARRRDRCSPCSCGFCSPAGGAPIRSTRG